MKETLENKIKDLEFKLKSASLSEIYDLKHQLDACKFTLKYYYSEGSIYSKPYKFGDK